MRKLDLALLAAVVVLHATSSHAGMCDYRPSSLIGGGSTAAVITGAGGVAAAGAAAKAAGVYTLVHATTGATMVGGTWAGASAAGTAGILAGTGGAVGTAVAVVTAPATIIGGVIVVASVGLYEGACYFSDERVTDQAVVDAIVRDIAMTAPSELYSYVAAQKDEGAHIYVRDPDAENKSRNKYYVSDLYIVNDVLKHRDWGVNTTIGIIGKIIHPENSVVAE